MAFKLSAEYVDVIILPRDPTCSLGIRPRIKRCDIVRVSLSGKKDTQNCMASVTDGNRINLFGNDNNELWIADCYYAYRQTP